MAMNRLTSVASIRTRFYGPTNYKPSRIRVSDGGAFGEKARTLWFSIGCHEGSHQEMHHDAAQAWLDKYNEGATVEGAGYGFESDYYWTWKRA